MTTYFNEHEAAARNIIAKVGKNIVIGVPLGLGKPIGLLNALYRLAEADQTLSLTIITGLTLSRPLFKNSLEKRFVEPIINRLLKDFEDPLYEKPRKLQKLPNNINVIEFFLATGEYLHNSYVQQNYINSNYTNVVRDTVHHGINVIGQQVAHSVTDANKYSLSCNSDLFKETVQYLKQLQHDGMNIAVVAEVNNNLPFMYGVDAVIASDTFTDIIDTGQYKTLFPLPREELTPQDHLIGLYASCLIKDNSALQIGIGKLGISIANAMILRHKENTVFCDLLNKLLALEKFGKTIAQVGSSMPFEQGIYASTEMFSDEYMQLYKNGILSKRVYSHSGLQQLLNAQVITETVTVEMLDCLVEKKIINPNLTTADIKFLKKFGIIKPTIAYKDDYLILPNDERIPANLIDPAAKQKIIATCLGSHLTNGKIMHAGFFLGSVDFYQQLNQLSQDELHQIEMTTISKTNSILWSIKLSKTQRYQARFINSAMMLTLGGMAVSDGLKNSQEVSGVGGQFDFINMAQYLPDARSILMCKSTRKTKQGVQSNVLWDYSNLTVPRCLRDIVITEYGIADCRSKTDADVMQAMLNITDSRFQNKLLKTAKKYGKIPKNYQIPDRYKNNYPEVIVSIIQNLQKQGYLKSFPFGSDLTDIEIILAKALTYLKNCSTLKLIALTIRALFYFSNDQSVSPYLTRMQLDKVTNATDFIYKKLFKFILHKKRYELWA